MIMQELINLVKYTVDEKSVSDVKNTMQSIKSTATKLLGAIGITLTLNGIKQFTQDCVQVASDVSEMESKFAVVFGSVSDEAEAWADNMSSYMGRSVYDLKTYIADAQNLLMGFSDGNEEARATSADLAEQMTETALNIASFANTEDDVAIRRMTQAVMGSSEAAKMLGAVLNDTTRAQAMADLSLSGTYDKLNQYTKMQVNLKAIQNQSKDAIDDCHNSMDRYESRTRQLTAVQKDLKVYLGTQLLPLMTLWNEIQVKLTEGTLKFAKAIFGENEENNKLEQVTNWLRNAYERLTTTLGKVKENFTKIADKLGGMENTIKIVTILIGALALVMNFETGVKAVQKVVDVFEKLNKVLGGSKRVMLLAAAIAFLVLVIEDFVNFMQGNDSLVGELFKKAGIDADEMRQKITQALEDAQTVISNVVEGIKNTMEGAFQVVRDFFGAFNIDIGANLGEGIANLINLISGLLETLANSPEKAQGIGKAIAVAVAGFAGLKTGIGILKGVIGAVTGVKTAITTISDVKKAGFGIFDVAKGFSAMIGPGKTILIVLAALAAIALLIYANWDKVKNYLLPIWETIKGAATEVFGYLQEFWSKHGEQIKTAFTNVWNGIQKLLTTAWTIIKTVATVVFGALKAFWDTWGGAIITTFSSLWNTVKTVFGSAWGVIKNIIGTALDVIVDLFAIFAALFAGDWESVWENVKQLGSDLWNGISDIITSIVEAIRSTVESIWQGILDTLSGIGEAIKESFSDAIDWITSLPDKAFQWGADIIGGIVDGIKSVAENVEEAVGGVADKIRSFLGFSEPKEGPLSDFHTYMPDMIDLMTSGIENGRNKVRRALEGLTGGMAGVTQNIEVKSDVSDAAISNIEALKNKYSAVIAGIADKAHASSDSSFIAKAKQDIAALKEEFNSAASELSLNAKASSTISAEAASESKGASNGQDSTLDMIYTLLNAFYTMEKTAYVRDVTVAVSAGGTRGGANVTQNVTINNKFSGDKAAQRDASSAMDKSAKDATSKMARALAYAR